ncbi:hypothetical protein [Marilutibacter alkalisoli]|uniref:Uncharacterized protein n=1 Tax=Marilutibacter alkalisoli TaxID=2591633 RepID=A0A514BTY9_9GAMM|nr:hypothetical protein [Lysobacter alkalisoli]QDH70840.1 hypothetical protein FKV23_12675 [Lysobacter alkalisoli]
MADRDGYLVSGDDFGADLPPRSANIINHAHLDWDVRIADTGLLYGAGARTPTLPVASHVVARDGYIAHSYFDDFYHRIHVVPRDIALGNLATEQIRVILVWNAFLTEQTLTDTPIVNGDGIEITPPAMLPITFAPLQQLDWEIKVTTDGPSRIDATITYVFTGLDDTTVTITGDRLQAWPLPADWGSAVDESLEWLTDVQQAIDGGLTREPKRDAPRRGWSFDLVEGARERRIIENLVYDWAGRNWVLPVMTDGDVLATAVPAGSTVIAVDTVGVDYRDGGLALLWRDALDFELVEIETRSAIELALVRPTLKPWPVGTRIWPCRVARMVQAPTWRRKSSQVIVSRVQFEAQEPCDWPAIAPSATYLGHPVLEQPIEESEDPTQSTPRQLFVSDAQVGPVIVDDITDLAWQDQSHAWKLWGRAERAAHRSLLYWLDGRSNLLWVPTWSDDIELLDPVGASSQVLTVANARIALALRSQPGRRHLRIALHDGSVFYRRVEASSELDSARESLLLDSALGVEMDPAQVRLICWMSLSTLAADRVTYSHTSDSRGESVCRVRFAAAPAEEP